MPPRLSTGSAAQWPAIVGQHVLGLPEQLLRRQLAGEAGEVDGDAGQLDAGQAGELGGDRRGGVRQDAFAAVAEVDGEQDLDGGAGGVLAEHAGGARVAQQHAVGHLGRRLELVALGRADERERPQRLSGEPDQRGQAAVGEAGAAGLEQRPPDRGLAVHALGDADERQAAGVQVRGETPRGAGDGVEVDGEPGEASHPSPLRLVVSGPAGACGSRPRMRAVPRPRSASRSGRGPPAGRGRGAAGAALARSGRDGARQRRRVLEVVHFAAGEGGATTIVRACVYHSVRVSRSRWDKAGAVYFADRPFDKQGERMPATDPLYTVCDGHLCFDGVDLVELAEHARDARSSCSASAGCGPTSRP